MKGTSCRWSTGLLNRDPGSDKVPGTEADGELGSLLGKKAGHQHLHPQSSRDLKMRFLTARKQAVDPG